jgi:hypothetical protein
VRRLVRYPLRKADDQLRNRRDQYSRDATIPARNSKRLAQGPVVTYRTAQPGHARPRGLARAGLANALSQSNRLGGPTGNTWVHMTRKTGRNTR